MSVRHIKWARMEFLSFPIPPPQTLQIHSSWSWWKLHPSSCSDQKSWGHPLLFSLTTPHPNHQKLLLVLSSNIYISRIWPPFSPSQLLLVQIIIVFFLDYYSSLWNDCFLPSYSLSSTQTARACVSFSEHPPCLPSSFKVSPYTAARDLPPSAPTSDFIY